MMLGLWHENSYIAVIMTDEPATIGGTPRAAKRPAHVKAPEGWTNAPVPAPEPIREEDAADQPGGRNPVRYGDWELKGLAIDF
jgi:hypothetical protein